MSLQNVQITNFTAGELGPKLSARFDSDIYAKGCLTLENWIPFSQGGITTRPGSKYLGITKSGAGAVIVPFVVSNDEAYIVEFTVSKIRFWHDDAVFQVTGSDLELSTTYTLAHCKQLKFAQDGNKLYVVHASYAPSVITWTGSTFTYATIGIVGNAGALPFQSSGNYPSSVACFAQRLWFAGSTNEPQTIWASKSFIYSDGDDWAASTDYAVGQIVSHDTGKLYRCVTSGTSGATGPSGTGTAITDGTAVWDYWCAEGQIDFTYFDTVEYDTTVLKPADEWADPDVAETETVITFKDIISDDSAMKLTPSQDLGSITDLVAGRSLLIGRVMGEQVIESDVTALDPKVTTWTRFGVEAVQGLLVHDTIVFLQGYATQLREYKYSSESEAYQSADLTFHADHILADGTAVVDMDYALVPEPTIFCVRSDGQMAALLHNPTVGTSAWHRYVAALSATYESVAVVTGTTADAIYVTVNHGTGYVCLEKFDKVFDSTAIPLDSWVNVASIAGATQSGLERFNGKTVTIYNVTDSTIHTATVTAGSLTYPTGDGVGDHVVIGGCFTCTMKTERVTTQGPYGTAQMQSRRIGRVYVRVLSSYAFKLGYVNTSSLLETVVLPSTAPYTGDIACQFNGDWGTDAWVMAIQDQPYHTTILGMVPEVEG